MGDEISKGIKNLTIKEKLIIESLIEDSVFEVDKAKQKKTSSGLLNRFRREKEKKTKEYSNRNLHL